MGNNQEIMRNKFRENKFSVYIIEKDLREKSVLFYVTDRAEL